MARVERIDKRGSGYTVTVSRDGAPLKLHLSGEKIIEYSILRGSDISDDVLDTLISDEEIVGARKKALSILAYGDKSRSALYERLIHAGYSDEASRLAVEYVLSYGYIDEARQVESAVKRLALSDLKSRRFILMKLISLGYEESLASTIIDDLVDKGEIDFTEIGDRLACREGVSGEEKRQLLLRRGFIEEDF